MPLVLVAVRFAEFRMIRFLPLGHDHKLQLSKQVLELLDEPFAIEFRKAGWKDDQIKSPKAGCLQGLTRMTDGRYLITRPRKMSDQSLPSCRDFVEQQDAQSRQGIGMVTAAGTHRSEIAIAAMNAP